LGLCAATLVPYPSGGASADYVSNRFRSHPNIRTLNHAASFPRDLMRAMGAMTVGGVLEKFPELRVGFLEGNCGCMRLTQKFS
jgi:hypothetical protein